MRPSPAEADWRIGGEYQRLTDGKTYWRREGPRDGVPLVLVHGATVPSWEFDALVPPLLAGGFQTLRFDLYGHGASERPRLKYSFDLFKRQVIEIVEATQFPRPAMFLGHSFGAALVAAVAAERPDWISRLVLVAPMLDFSSSTTWTRLFRYPGIGELAMEFIGIPALIRRRRRRYEEIGKGHLAQRFNEQVKYAGFSRGLLSMSRTGALGNQGAKYAGLGAFRKPVLVISGNHDGIIPRDHLAQVRSLLPAHEHFALDAEHNLLLTHPNEVVEKLVRWSG